MAATFENQHLEQCNSLPIDSFNTARHGVHLNPCYKKFTKIISVARSKESREGDPRHKRMKANEAGSSHGFFPKVCMFCNQYRKTVRIKFHNAYKILTKEQNIKCASNVKNDLPLLCQIQDVDLIAKELMIHKKCYLDCTRILDSSVEKGREQLPRQLGDIESVKTFIKETVLEQNQAV